MFGEKRLEIYMLPKVDPFSAASAPAYLRILIVAEAQ
jgi:hypothetical protein